MSTTAIPSQFPNLPSYHSSTKTSRDSLETKRNKVEQELLMRALQESEDTKQKYDESRQFSSIEGFSEKLHFLSKVWNIIKKSNSVIIINIQMMPVPKIKYSVIINESLNASAFDQNVELDKVGKFSFPCVVNNVNNLNDILDELINLDSKILKKQKPITNSIINALKSLEACDGINEDMLKFLIEQITFLNSNKHIGLGILQKH